MELIMKGKRGPSVELLQLALKRYGLYKGKIDGIFGNETHNALVQFQKDNGLKPDGIAGMKTWQALMPYLKGYVKTTIKSGDSFWKLAQKYNTTVRSISTANPFLDPMDLEIGAEIIIPLNFDVVPTDVSFTSTVLNIVIDGLTTRYPFIKKSSYGKSVMGKDLHLLKIGNGSTHVFYNATHHANEWINTPVLLKFLEEYSNAYATGSQIYGLSAMALFSTTTLFMAPMVNPDGVDLVLNAIPKQSDFYIKAKSFAENYPEIPFPSGWKSNIMGVDLNLQYPANWNKAKEIKYSLGFTKPGPRDFVGKEPLSEPESKAIYFLTLNNDFALTLSYHTQGSIIYWKYLDYNPKGAEEIAEKFSDASGYALEITPYASSFAGYKDWFIQNYNRPGYTIETGLGVNPIPISQFDKIYSDNIGILALGMSESLML